MSTVIRHFRKEAVNGGSSVGKATGCMDEGIFFRIVAGERDISVLRSVQTVCVVHPASFSPGDKAAGT